MEIKQNELLKSLTSWQIGGRAEFLCFPKNFSELSSAIQFAMEQAKPVTVLSGGSNVLISDQGIPGMTICLKNYVAYQAQIVKNEIVIDCDSGMPKSELLRIFLKYKLKPALFLAGIPGDVGGGIVMNAGVSEQIVPREFCEIVDSFEVLKWKNHKMWTEKFTHKDIQWSYRHSSGWQDGIITRVRLRCANEPDMEIIDQVRVANRSRLLKQPLDRPSCGSVFVNPEGHKAAQLIDSTGLKGFQIGDAQVSIKHANFIVNMGNATATDTWKLICHVQEKVFAKHKVQLKTEVVRLGKWDGQ